MEDMRRYNGKERTHLRRKLMFYGDE